MTKKTKRAILLIVAVGSLATAGAAVAGANDDDRASDDAGERITDKAAADRASAAALREVGGGTVEGVENADDGEKGYEVEVRRADGSGVEVQVSPGFDVSAVETDD